jgi:hypothetical protein
MAADCQCQTLVEVYIMDTMSRNAVGSTPTYQVPSYYGYQAMVVNAYGVHEM